MNEISVLLFLIPRILIAILCGIIIGLERELKNKVAGIRTHVLVCVGVTIFAAIPMILNISNIDPTRVIGQICTGVGFLGAGVIFRNDDKIVGVTSAAFIWFIASVGVLIGVGYFITPVIITLGLLLTSYILSKVETKIFNYLKKKKENS